MHHRHEEDSLLHNPQLLLLLLLKASALPCRAAGDRPYLGGSAGARMAGLAPQDAAPSGPSPADGTRRAAATAGP